MSFNGDLEHLPIVDVVQLLHATRKSGTLTVKGRKGESQLVFSDGAIVSANHCDNNIRIGRILVEARVISEEMLARALREQNAAGEKRKPLVAALIENGLVKKEDAYRGLETLIELTIVEVLTWKSGTFTLDVAKAVVSDEYRYFPEKLHEETHFHTENVLMDALRIYDEKKRDGTLGEPEPGAVGPPGGAIAGEEGDLVLSADDLGLDDLERLERKVPEVFLGLEDRPSARGHRRRITELAADLSAPEREAIIMFLENLPAPVPAAEGVALSVLLFSADALMTYCLTAVCRQEGLHVFATNEEKDLDPVIDQFLAKSGVPVLVLDTPGGADQRIAAAGTATLRRRLRERHPHLITVQLADPRDGGFPHLVSGEGVLSILPRPVREARRETFVADATRFLATFPTILKEHLRGEGGWLAEGLRDRFRALRQQTGVPGVAAVLLRSVAAACERSLTLVVRGTELIADKGIGIPGGNGREAAAVPGVRISLMGPSLLQEVVRTGRCYGGGTDDAVIREHLFARIGAPLHPTVLLLPLRVGGKTVSLTYGDCGPREVPVLPIGFLEILAEGAGLVLETLWYRKKLEKPAP